MRGRIALFALLIAANASAQTVTVTDDFDRPELGLQWTQILPGLSITSELVIDGQAVHAVLPNTAAAAFYHAAIFADNQWAQCRVTAPFYAGPVVRSTGTVASGGWNNYEAYSNSAVNIRIARHVNNTPKTLANFPAPWSGIARMQDGDVLRLEAIGSLLRVFLNGVVVGQVRDLSHASGSPGVITHAGTQTRVDEFAAGDLLASQP